MRAGIGWRIKLATAAILAVSACIDITNAAQAIPRLCIVPVRDGASTEAYINGNLFVSLGAKVPGAAGPVFEIFGKVGWWTLDRDHRLVPSAAPPANPHKGNGAPWSNAETQSSLFRQTLTYGGGPPLYLWPRWRRRGPDGYSDIPDGDVGIAFADTGAVGNYHDLPSLNRGLIQGKDGLFLYDGRRIRPVPDSGPDRVSRYARIYDLQAIGRVVVSSGKGFFELSADNKLNPVSVPFAVREVVEPVITDWPEAGVALVSTQRGIFALDRDLHFHPVDGGERVGYYWSAGVSRIANGDATEILLSGRSGLFVAIDASRSADDPCKPLQELERIPQSDVCLRPVPTMNDATVGGAIFSIAEGPANSGLLLATVSGTFLLDANETITRIAPETRRLANIPWSGEVLAVGSFNGIIYNEPATDELGQVPRKVVMAPYGSVLPVYLLPTGYSELVAVLPTIQIALVTPGSNLSIVRRDGDQYHFVGTKTSKNDVRTFVDAPWFGFPIVANWYGLFSLDRDGRLSSFNVEGSEASVGNKQLSVSMMVGEEAFFSAPRFRTIYARRRGWFRITPDRKWLPVTGMPAEAIVLRHFDPGVGPVLFGTTLGLFAVSEDGSARRLDGPQRTVRALAAEAGNEMVLAGGDDGLFEISLRTLDVRRVTNGGNETIGSVQRISNADYAAIDIVEASNGVYSVENGVLREIPGLRAVNGLGNVQVFSRVRRTVVTTHDGASLLEEVGRYNAAGGCMPLATSPH